MELYYRNDDLSKVFQSITKKGVVLRNLKLKEKALVIPIKQEKIKDLETLLSLYLENWKEEEKLKFFKDVLDDTQDGPQNVEKDEGNKECDCNYFKYQFLICIAFFIIFLVIIKLTLLV